MRSTSPRFRCGQIPGNRLVPVGGHKSFDTADFIAECRRMQVTPMWRRTTARRQCAGLADEGRAGSQISQGKRSSAASTP